MREEEGRNSLQKIPFSSFPVGIYRERGRGKRGGGKAKKCGSRGKGMVQFCRWDTISYEIREIKSVEKREISGSWLASLCFARADPSSFPANEAKSECKRDTRTMNPEAELSF